MIKIINEKTCPFPMFMKILYQTRHLDCQIAYIPALKKNIHISSPQAYLLLKRKLLLQEKNGVKPVRVSTSKKRQARRAINKYKKINKDESNCFYCGCTLNETNSMDIFLKQFNKTIDHFIPLSEDGSNTPDNFKMSCSSCNTAKADLNPEKEPIAYKYFLKWIKKKLKNPKSKFNLTQARKNQFLILKKTKSLVLELS